MKPLAKALIALVALEHLMFFVLESFFWTSDFGMKTFGTTPALAESSKVLAMNQGVYNGFLAACLGVALVARDERLARAFATFGLACVVVAGVVGGVTAKVDILFVQALPAAIALAVVRLGRR